MDDDAVFEAVKASAAFPIAFQPVRLLYYDVRLDNEGNLIGTPQTDLFLDGGAFDNNPVGLALDFYAEQKNGAGVADTIDMLFVNPGRRRGQSEPPEGDTRIPPGGTANSLQFLAGAVSTARQYELQLLARGSALDDSIHYRLRFTDRHSPIFGTHLGAFAAFIAREMREYDFHVGAYDGLHFIVREYACAGSSDTTCIPRKLKELVTSGVIALDPPGRAVAAMNYNAEFNDSIDGSAVSSAAETARINIFREFHAALPLGESPTTHDCGGRALGPAILCADGLLDVVTVLQANKEDLLVWHRTIIDECRSAAAARCDTSFARFLEDPNGESERLVERFIARLALIEAWMHDRQVSLWRSQGNERNTAIEKPSSTAERAAEIAYWAYRISSAKNQGMEWDPSTIPDDPNHWLHGFPFYVGANIGASGYELGWRPSVNASRNWGLAVPLLLHWNRDIGVLDGKSDAYAGAGIACVLRGIPWIGSVINEASFGLNVWTPIFHEEPGPFGSYEAGFRTLGGLLQVSYRQPFERGRMHGDDHWGIFIGIADLNGLIYWGSRIIR